MLLASSVFKGEAASIHWGYNTDAHRLQNHYTTTVWRRLCRWGRLKANISSHRAGRITVKCGSVRLCFCGRSVEIFSPKSFVPHLPFSNSSATTFPALLVSQVQETFNLHHILNKGMHGVGQIAFVKPTKLSSHFSKLPSANATGVETDNCPSTPQYHNGQ